MKSRAIALGASVIALTLANGGQAVAGGLEDFGQGLKAETETSVRAPGGASAEVEGAVRVPVQVPSKPSVKDITKAAGKDATKLVRQPRLPSATVEAEQRSGKDRSEVVVDLNRDGVSAYVDQRRKGEFELEAEGQASPRGAESTVTGYTRRTGKGKADLRARSPKANAAKVERSVRDHARQATRKGVSRVKEGDKPLERLQGIGREVTNAIRLSFASWLIALAAFGGFAATRLLRRLQRTS
jgi:hypothetical protein